LMLFPKHNLLITRFNSALQIITQTSKQNNPTSTIGIHQRKNCDPYQPMLLHTHLVSWKPTSSRHRLNVSYHLAAFHLA
jgi:hypothetical protein